MDGAGPRQIVELQMVPDKGVNSSPWADLRSDYLESLADEDRARIAYLAASMVPELDKWAARFPIIRRVRVWPLAMSVAAASPTSSLEALISTARVSLWVFTLDDVFDEALLPDGELERAAEQYRNILQNQRVSSSESSLAAALFEVIDDLRKFPLYDSIGNEWRRALCGTIDGMLREHHWRQSYQYPDRLLPLTPMPLPSYEEYVANGLHSIGGPPHVWAAIITTEDESIPQHVEHLRSMERVASTCVRLANDLRSYEKEVAEGNINALVILGDAFRRDGLSPEEAHLAAEARVKADITRGLESLADLQQRACTELGKAEAAVANIARFVCEFYSQHDYHTFLRQHAEGTGM